MIRRGDIQRQVNTLIRQAPFATNGSGAAYVFGDILVSAGNVSILAKTLSGTGGSVNARDSVSINIDNQGLNFLNLGKLTVTGVLGGHLNFTGNATDQTSTGITYHSDLTGASPTIFVNASYNRKDPNTGLGIDQSGQPLVTTPDIYFDGVVSNLNGLFSITNQLGNVVATQSFNALNVEMNVPNGAFTFNGSASTIYNLRGDVAAQWAGVEYKPTDTLTAVEAAATWLGTYGSAYLGGNGNYHPYNYYFSNSGTTFVNAPVTQYADANQVFTARLLSLAYAGSLVLGGLPADGRVQVACGIPDAATLAAAEGTTTSHIILSPWERHNFEDRAYGDGGHGGPINCQGCRTYFQAIEIQPYAVTPKTAASANVPAQNVLNIGKALILSAGVININGAVQVGQSSNFSANIGTDAMNIINNTVNDPGKLATARSDAANGTYRQSYQLCHGERRRYQGRRPVQRAHQSDHAQQRGAGHRRLRLSQRQDHQHVDDRQFAGQYHC